MTFRETDGSVMIRAIDLARLLVAAFAARAYPQLCLDICGSLRRCRGARCTINMIGTCDE